MIPKHTHAEKSYADETKGMSCLIEDDKLLKINKI